MTFKEASEILIAGGVLGGREDYLYYKLDACGRIHAYTDLSCNPDTESWETIEIEELEESSDVTEEHINLQQKDK